MTEAPAIHATTMNGVSNSLRYFPLATLIQKQNQLSLFSIFAHDTKCTQLYVCDQITIKLVKGMNFFPLFAVSYLLNHRRKVVTQGFIHRVRGIAQRFYEDENRVNHVLQPSVTRSKHKITPVLNQHAAIYIFHWGINCCNRTYIKQLLTHSTANIFSFIIMH